MEISEPSVLTRVARPQIENGRILFAPVYSLVNGSKRKRQELCAAVDGNSINVYEVHNGKNLSSCPIPPDSTLSCPPCALRSTTQEGRKIRRIYYIASRRNENSLTVFQEGLNESGRRPVSKSVPLENTSSPVVQLEVLPVPQTHQILIIREDTGFEIYNEDLSSQIRHGKLYGLTEGSRLVAAQWLTPTQALKSVLKARPDVVAMADSGTSFLLGIFSVSDSQTSGGGTGIELGVWPLSGLSSGFFSEPVSAPVLYHKLRISSPLAPRERDPIVFASKNTRLIIKTQQPRIYTFDLTSTTPQRIQETSPMAADHLNSIVVSDSLTLSSTSATLQLHNTQYRTLQAKLDLNKNGSKRKRSHTSGGPISFCAYFPNLNRVIASRRDQLIAIDLQNTGTSDFSVAAKQTSLLINNVGRGVISQERLKCSDHNCESLVGRTTKQRELVEQWNNVIKRLEQCIQEKDFAKFEQIYLEHMDSSATKSSYEPLMLTDYKADYAISKIFEYKIAPGDAATVVFPNLCLAFPAPKVVEMLAVRGFLSSERIGKVLRANTKLSFEPVKHGSISQLLIDSDASLGLLDNFLAEAPHIAHQELCAAVLLLLRRALAESNISSSFAITDTQQSRLAVEDSVDIVPASANVKEAISLNITQCLCGAIERLVKTAHCVLAGFIRESFFQGEIIALVQFLRQQLFRSGYTRLQALMHPTPPPSESDSPADSAPSSYKKTDLSLAAIASTLSSCIDAIGPIGVLSFGDEEKFVQTLIPELSSEISKATEALQDMTYVEGLLRETLRFIDSTTLAETEDLIKDGSHTIRQTKPGTIITLFAESATDGSLDPSSAALPLGLRAKGRISSVKVRKGDGRISKRSEREMGMHQDRLRGPYALEQLSL